MELLERNLAVAVFVCLDNGAVDKLLQLDVVQVVADHHLQHLEQLAVRDEAVVVDVVDLEGESQLLLVARARRQTVEALYEFKETNAAVVVAVEHVDDSLHKWVVRQLWDVEELLRLESARLVLIKLVEVFVELLEFFLSEI